MLSMGEANENPNRPTKPAWKGRLWDFLEDVSSSAGEYLISRAASDSNQSHTNSRKLAAANAWSVLNLVVVLLATLFFVMESVEEFRTKEFVKFLDMFEAASIYFFTVEYSLRFFAAKSRRKFFFTFQNLIDLGAITPYYVTIALENSGSGGLGILRIVRLTKVFRIIRISRYSKGLNVVIQSISDSASDLCVLGVLLFIVILLFGSIVQIIENGMCEGETEEYDSEFPSDSDQCKHFRNIPMGMWWATVTLTTVGYGDTVPYTTAGKFIGGVCMVCGLLVLAGPIAVLSNSFNHTFTKNKFEEHKRVIAVQHRQNMLRLSANRGKQSLWRNIRMVVQSDAKVAFTVKSFKQFISYLFLKYDTDGSGYLDIEEVKNAMGTLGMNMANDSDLHALVHECKHPTPHLFFNSLRRLHNERK